jgi:hypothetical protein
MLGYILYQNIVDCHCILDLIFLYISLFFNMYKHLVSFGVICQKDRILARF